jgi:hypothetical protein
MCQDVPVMGRQGRGVGVIIVNSDTDGTGVFSSVLPNNPILVMGSSPVPWQTKRLNRRCHYLGNQGMGLESLMRISQ